MLNNLSGQWMYFSWYYNQGGNHLIHPEDLHLLVEKGIGVVFCLSDNGEFLTLESNFLIFRAKRNGINRVLPEPAFRWGQKVNILSKNNMNAIVRDILWHFKDDMYYYCLIINKKINKKRYTENEIIALLDE